MKIPMLLAAMTAVCLVHAQAKPAQKPVAKPAPAQTRPVLGTAQLAGDNGKLNQAYTMGQTQKLNIVLTGVRYTKTRWNVGETSVAPDRNEKLMILSFQIQNPNNEITSFYAGSMKFTAIDQENENHEGESHVMQKSGDRELSIELKPAQRIDCETAIVVPAKGVVPKLMVAHRSGGAVLRYDLHDAIKPLEKPFSENGSDAAAEFKGEADTYYPLLQFDAKYLSTAFKERQLGNNTTDDAHIYMLAKMTFKKQSATGHILRFEGEAVDEDGDRYPSTSIRKASSEDHMASTAELGQEVSGRMSFVIPKGVKITKLRVWEYQGKKSAIVEFPVNAYATADGLLLSAKKPEAAAAVATVTTVDADEYTTVFRKSDAATTAMEVTHLERRDGGSKTTEISVSGKRALLLEEAEATTLYLPETNEVLRAPKAKAKEPTTSLAYYAMAYANSVAPKPKKRNPFGDIVKAVGGQAANDFGQQMVSGAVMSGFGQATMSKVVENGLASTVQGYAVQNLASQLGRAVMTSAQPSAGGPERVQASVAVDKKVYAETNFRGAKKAQPETLKIDGAAAKSTDATTLYQRFTEFMASGLK